jgi:hypothetical protein
MATSPRLFLDAALAGAVQEAVEQAVKQAVQAARLKRVSPPTDSTRRDGLAAHRNCGDDCGMKNQKAIPFAIRSLGFVVGFPPVFMLS